RAAGREEGTTIPADAERPGARLVGRSPRARLAPAHTGAEPADTAGRWFDRAVLAAAGLADVPPLAEEAEKRSHVGLPGGQAEVRLAPVQLAVGECEVEGALRLDRLPEEVLIRDVGGHVRARIEVLPRRLRQKGLRELGGALLDDMREPPGNVDQPA